MIDTLIPFAWAFVAVLVVVAMFSTYLELRRRR